MAGRAETNGVAEEKTRFRILTEKGMEYQLDRKLKFRQGCDRRLKTLSDNIQELISTSTDVNEVKELYKRWLRSYYELLYAHEDFHDLMKISSRNGTEDDSEFQNRNEGFLSVKRAVEKWFMDHSKNQSQTDNRSVKTRLSNLSKQSKVSSQISVEKVREEQKKQNYLLKQQFWMKNES
jgi:hypothetical protein